jgi:transcription factor S
MMFCPKCGSLLVPVDKGGKKVIGCSCGFVLGKKESVEIKEVVSPQKKDEIVAIEKEVVPYPLTEVECPKCHHGKAYYWTVQTRAGDEPETKFMKCESCKHVWRDYG